MPSGRSDLDAIFKVRSVPADEPQFWLRGQDQLAADTVRDWARRAKDAGVAPAVVEQALSQADAMEAWPTHKLPDDGHLTEPERKQLTYQHARRVWADRERDDRAAGEAWGRQLAREQYAERIDGLVRELDAARAELEAAKRRAETPIAELLDSAGARQVLGLMCFELGPVAHLFAATGEEIKAQAEDEQSFMLRYLLKLVAEHGEFWPDALHVEIKRRQALLPPKKTDGPAAAEAAHV